MNVFLTGVGPRLKKLIDVQNCQNWAIDIRYKLDSQVDQDDSQYLHIDLPKDKLVYLTADSDNLL